jgi:hypothetical protein
VAELKDQINAKIKDAERLGEEGQIEEAQEIVAEIEKLKAECKYLENVSVFFLRIISFFSVFETFSGSLVLVLLNF